MMSFVVIATMRRGALKIPEPLDDVGQTLAIMQWERDGPVRSSTRQSYSSRRDGWKFRATTAWSDETAKRVRELMKLSMIVARRAA